MGILNITPDSFSDGGKFIDLDVAVRHAEKLVADGADIIDIGGESTRPGAKEIGAEEEQTRILSVVETISQRLDVLISVDTYRASTAEKAINAGAHIVNDVTGLTGDTRMKGVIAAKSCGVCIMHTSRRDNLKSDLLNDQFYFLKPMIEAAMDCGVAAEAIVLDPGFGFGKDADDNLLLLNRFTELLELGFPILTGTSRKRFTANSLSDDHTMVDRDVVTASTSVIARMSGSAIFRVHDVALNKKALDMVDGVIAAQ